MFAEMEFIDDIVLQNPQSAGSSIAKHSPKLIFEHFLPLLQVSISIIWDDYPGR
jgi:hypothetical protein